MRLSPFLVAGALLLVGAITAFPVQASPTVSVLEPKSLARAQTIRAQIDAPPGFILVHRLIAWLASGMQQEMSNARKQLRHLGVLGALVSATAPALGRSIGVPMMRPVAGGGTAERDTTKKGGLVRAAAGRRE